MSEWDSEEINLAMLPEWEPRRLLVAGDCHGNPSHIVYLFECALQHNASAIFEVGDFGFWEHGKGGPEYLDVVSELAILNAMPFFWIDGNHENHTLLRERYADAPKTKEGFWQIRPGLFYVPRGTRWEWQGKKIMGLGGGYSVDRDWRLFREQNRHQDGTGRWRPPTGPRTMWWPEEEISDEELAYALSDPTPLDLLFCHDKPRASNPEWNRKDILECYPNQDKIQTVVQTLTPRLIMHGHLHFPYQDIIRCGDDDKKAHVIALACDSDTPKKDSWVILNLA